MLMMLRVSKVAYLQMEHQLLLLGHNCRRGQHMRSMIYSVSSRIPSELDLSQDYSHL